MNAREIRIGSWYYNHMSKKDVLITKKNIVGFMTHEVTDNTCYLSPILLTEEWLIENGLLFSGYNSEDKAIYKKDDEIWIVKNIVTKQFYLNGYEKEIKYVHKLQNLYYELKGEEIYY